MLDEGIKTGCVQETDQRTKHTIDGVTSSYPVYRIRIDKLFYNNQNDRIATWVSAWRAEHNGEDPISLGREEYNDIIEGFIVQSNTDAIRKTQANIAMFGQRVPGVVLNDGRVIDGNRRLTCIRRIAKDSGKSGWFDAVILPDEIASEPKRIKMLELSIQHGEEGKVDYDPIERLVGVYNDIIKEKVLTPAEYAKSAFMKESDVNKLIEQANYMEEFLVFANAPEQYHLARELAIAGPLGEMSAILKKSKSEGDKALIKQALFANIIVQPAGDITRFVRRFKKVVGTGDSQTFLGEEENLVAEVVDRMKGKPLSKSAVSALRANKRLVGKFSRVVEKADEKVRISKLSDAPVEKTKKAIEDLEAVLPEMLDRLNEEQLEEVKDNLNTIIKLAKKISIEVINRE